MKKDMKRVRVTAMEEQIFCVVLDKLVGMHPKARRVNRSWVKLKYACQRTGNWKRAVSNPNPSFGGKRSRGFARRSVSVPVRETVYVPTGTYD